MLLNSAALSHVCYRAMGMWLAYRGLEVILINLNANSPWWLVELLQLGRKRPRLTLISFLPSPSPRPVGKVDVYRPANDTQETARKILQLGVQGKWSRESKGLEDCKLAKGLPQEAGRERGVSSIVGTSPGPF